MTAASNRPLTAADAHAWGNDGRARWYSSSSGRIELAITLEDAEAAYHQGQCDKDVAELARVPYVADQLAGIDAATLSAELEQCAAWDAEELADHAQNIQRILWLACGDIGERAACGEES